MSQPTIRRLGIISALQQEQSGLVEAMQGTATVIAGKRDYTTGTLWGVDSVCVLSRIGKVAAAMTATLLVEKFDVSHILFTGVAGGGNPAVKVGDIVIADHLVQHDMDASPLFPPGEVPLIGIKHFATDPPMTAQLAQAAQAFLAQDFADTVLAGDRQLFGLQAVSVRRGLVASGDQFIHSQARVRQLEQDHPALLAVEMEGAAVAQVCFEYGVPFAVLRTISDNANETAATDFLHFVQAVAAPVAYGIVKRFCQQSANAR